MEIKYRCITVFVPEDGLDAFYKLASNEKWKLHESGPYGHVAGTYQPHFAAIKFHDDKP